MQHTAALAVAAVVITLSTALPTPTSGLGGGDDVSGELISELFSKMVKNLYNTAKKMTSLEEEINEQQSVIEEQAAELQTQAEINEKLSIFYIKMNESMSKIEDDVRNKTKDFKEEVASQKEKIEQLGKENTKQQNAIGKIINENDDLKEEMTKLKSDVTSQKDDIEQLGQDNTQQQTAIASIKDENNDQARKLGQLETDIKTEERTNTAQASQLTKLASPQYFSVYLASHRTVPLNKVLVFDGVIDDPESLYSRSTGVFECKVPGVYVFTLTAISQGRKNIYVRLGIFKGHHLKATTRANGEHDQGSSTVTLTLKRGDKVTVKGVWATSHVKGDGGMWTTFSGRLVTPAE